MTKPEAAKIIYTITTAYPTAFKGTPAREINSMAELWAVLFADTPYELVDSGLRAYLRSDKSGFPPTVGQINGLIHDISDKQLPVLKAWALVRKAVRNSTYHADEEFAKLPPTVQKAVGRPANLHEWAAMEDPEAFETVVQSNFGRSYSAAVKREQTEALIPSGTLHLIRGISNGTLTADGKMVEDKESMIENDSRMLIVEEKA